MYKNGVERGQRNKYKEGEMQREKKNERNV